MGDQYGEITRPNRMRIQLNWAVTCEIRILGQDNKEIAIDCFFFFGGGGSLWQCLVRQYLNLVPTSRVISVITSISSLLVKI